MQKTCTMLEKRESFGFFELHMAKTHPLDAVSLHASVLYLFSKKNSVF